MTIYQELVDANITGIGNKVYYGVVKDKPSPPFLVYLGDGQENISADDTFVYSKDSYQIEYYFREKNPSCEEDIEAALLDFGHQYEKSADTYIDNANLFVIYYSI